MYSFKNDYAEGAHPSILENLLQTNDTQQAGYGEDEYSIQAKEILKRRMDNSLASIFFVSGGTQSNLLVISYLLRPHQAVISVNTGHIYANETGAIEATGHKVISVPSTDGKLQVESLEATLAQYALRPHVVQPKMVYISNSTELGTIYQKAELQSLYAFCQSRGLYLFVDGARLGHALTAQNNDIAMKDMAQYCDVFYIGATKNGALLGEAIVFNDEKLARDFDYSLKQKGALLAKGRLLGIQFLTLFQDNLYFDLALHANVMAKKLADAIAKKGYEFLGEVTSNQLFPILPMNVIERLRKHFDFYEWQNVSQDKVAIRLITSWATQEEQVDLLIEVLNQD